MKRYLLLIEIARAMKPLHQQLRAFHVAAIFKKNRLVSIGWNTLKTHPKTIEFYPYHQKATHGEALAIIRGRLENYRGHDLFVLRLDNNESINYSKPCKFCQTFIKFMEFDNVFYSDNDGQMKEFLIK